MDKIRINGLKLSSELVMLHFEPSTGIENSFAKLGRLFGDHKINILFMSTGTQAGQGYGICCIESYEKSRAEKLLQEKDNTLATSIRSISGIGLITLFPHKSSLKMVGLVLQNLGDHHISVYGLASSIAAITFVLDYQRLDDAAKVLGTCLQIPPSATPMRSMIKVKPVESRE